MKPLTNAQRRYLIRYSHAAVDVAMLGVFVVALYGLGLPSIVAIAVGAPLGVAVATIIGRRILPVFPPWSDEERVQVPRLRVGWLPVGLVAVALLYFIGHMRLAVAVSVIVLSIGVLVVGELRARRKAEERLSER